MEVGIAKVYRFMAEIDGDVYSRETFPIYDDSCKQLLGGFTLVKGNLILGFVAGNEHPTALMISTGGQFFFTPREDKNGNVSFGLLSDHCISPVSVRIPRAYEEETDVE